MTLQKFQQNFNFSLKKKNSIDDWNNFEEKHKKWKGKFMIDKYQEINDAIMLNNFEFARLKTNALQDNNSKNDILGLINSID